MLKSSKSTFVNLLLIILGLISILVMVSPKIAPTTWWPGGLLAYLVFPVAIGHILALPWLLYRRSWYILTVLAVIGLTVPHISKIYVWNSTKTSEIPDEQDHSFSLLSYNTSFFRAGTVFSEEYYSPEYNLRALQIRDWIRGREADIICLQEFFDDENSKIFNNLEFIGESGKYYHYFMNKPFHDNGTRRGIVTFSKFPIIDQKEIFLSDNRYNGAIYTDLVIYADTVRVINAHLASTNLLEKRNIPSIIRSLKKSVQLKDSQSDMIMQVILSSPYKVILCGDFNEVPVSYTYEKFTTNLYNAFEKAGVGFGTTLHESILFPSLRIDHHFVDPSITTRAFATHQSISYSDHYPIEGVYEVKDTDNKPQSQNAVAQY